MKFFKNNLLLIIVDVSASTGAFVGTVCLIAVLRAAQFRGQQDVVDVGELVRPLVFVHQLVLLLPGMYCLLDPSVHSVYKIQCVNFASRFTLVRQAEHLEYDFRNIDKKSLDVMSGHTHEALADH